jgi:phosphohistidine phosphatase
MDCLLFRHGIAADRAEWDGLEAERPLTVKGIQKTRQAAGGLRRLDVSPTVILASPLTRAIQTARLVQEAFRFKNDVQICDELLPDAPPDKLFPLLGTFPENACVICVGHEPHLGEAAGVMIFGRPASGLSLKKAGACLIQFDAMLKAGEGALRWWATPALLRSLRKS